MKNSIGNLVGSTLNLQIALNTVEILIILILPIPGYGMSFHAKSFIGKDPGKDWGLAEKGTTEDETVGWHNRLNEHGFGWTPGVGDGQGGLACWASWGRKESDMTERLN